MKKSYDSDSRKKLYEKVLRIIGSRTPLGKDCGVLCDCACCKGSDTDGMRLFPGETTTLRTVEAEGGTLAVCDGTCDREQRPLACRLFPLFPLTDERGHVTAGLDARAIKLCPLAEFSDEVAFDPGFVRAVRRAGRVLARDPECREYMVQVTEDIDMTARLYGR
ncbi:MAG: hypothetical protein E7559_02500 [Ruminococcaceae bacterium]|nr:hypothetical protein [Oscillospiraceae bacterium]